MKKAYKTETNIKIKFTPKDIQNLIDANPNVDCTDFSGIGIYNLIHNDISKRGLISISSNPPNWFKYQLLTHGLTCICEKKYVNNFKNSEFNPNNLTLVKLPWQK